MPTLEKKKKKKSDHDLVDEEAPGLALKRATCLATPGDFQGECYPPRHLLLGLRDDTDNS